ncbi:exosome complex component MTR3-like isoform X1 [Diprion similis]|uniref:exosome complex component MTR3-like isoform X1 n=1 Tax=Diprion similis TaxID=362088 RepID=UPI001EF8744C|nr:exosome complex component MTR3-like isoform X1 [Diprion similis]
MRLLFKNKMPFDQKRINGPEVSVPYSVYTDINKSKSSKPKKSLHKRVDGRQHKDLRKIFVKTGVISQAKGSAYIEVGTTKVVCSVFDPREIPNKNEYSLQGELFCEFKYAPFACAKRRIHQQDSEEKEFSLVMQRSLEPAVCRQEFPNFQVDVYAMVLDNGGSSLAAAIMCASLALADASVPMFGLVTAVSAGFYEDTMFLDLTVEEEILCNSAPTKANPSKNHGLIMQAALPQHDQISEFFLVGSIDVESIKQVIETLTVANKNICPVVQQCLVKTVLRALNRKEQETNEIKK